MNVCICMYNIYLSDLCLKCAGRELPAAYDSICDRNKMTNKIVNLSQTRNRYVRTNDGFAVGFG